MGARRGRIQGASESTHGPGEDVPREAPSSPPSESGRHLPCSGRALPGHQVATEVAGFSSVILLARFNKGKAGWFIVRDVEGLLGLDLDEALPDGAGDAPIFPDPSPPVPPLGFEEWLDSQAEESRLQWESGDWRGSTPAECALHRETHTPPTERKDFPIRSRVEQLRNIERNREEVRAEMYWGTARTNRYPHRRTIVSRKPGHLGVYVVRTDPNLLADNDDELVAALNRDLRKMGVYV